MKKVILLLMIAVYLASFTMSYAISDDSMDTLMKSIDDKLVVVSNSRSNTMFHVMVTDKMESKKDMIVNNIFTFIFMILLLKMMAMSWWDKNLKGG